MSGLLPRPPYTPQGYSQQGRVWRSATAGPDRQPFAFRQVAEGRRAAGGRSGRDSDGVHDALQLREVILVRIRRRHGRDHEALAVDVEDPELLDVGVVVAAEGDLPVVVQRREPAVELAVRAQP